MLSRLLLILSLLVPAISLAASFPIPPAIENVVKALRASEDPESRKRLDAFERLVAKLENVLDPRALADSLRRSRLTEQEIALMRKHSRGFRMVQELLAAPSEAEGYSLGYGGETGQYPMFSERLDLEPWQNAYARHGIDWYRENDHTNLFLEAITADERGIVFFVPNEALTHPKGAVTKEELLWFLKRPEKMRKVTFVFGGYDLVDDEMLALRERASLSRDEFRALFMRAIGNPVPSSWENSL